MEPKDKTNNEQEQKIDKDLVHVEEKVNIHENVLRDILPSLPLDIQERVRLQLANGEKDADISKLHDHVSTMHTDVLDMKSTLAALQQTVSDLTKVVTDMKVAPAPAPENKTPENKEPKDDKKTSDENKPDEKGTEKDKTPPASPQVDVKDAPVYLHIRKRGGRIVRRLAKQPQKAGA